MPVFRENATNIARSLQDAVSVLALAGLVAVLPVRFDSPFLDNVVVNEARASVPIVSQNNGDKHQEEDDYDEYEDDRVENDDKDGDEKGGSLKLISKNAKELDQSEEAKRLEQGW